MHWQDYWRFLMMLATRYFFVAGIAFLLLYVIFRKWTARKKIQKQFPTGKDYRREIGYSIVTMIIFAFVPLFVLKSPWLGPHTTYYHNIETHGMVYFILAFPLLFLIHDTYFYWMHRLIHHKKLFNLVHLVHHQSTNPSPWAAYSFHPLEAVAEAGIFVVFLFTIPVHPIHLLVFFILMIVYNVYGHLGIELYPKGFNRNWFGKWINTSVSHNQHHKYFKGNYGLYFTFWDRLMGTLRSDYDAQFEKVAGGTANGDA